MKFSGRAGLFKLAGAFLSPAPVLFIVFDSLVRYETVVPRSSVAYVWNLGSCVPWRVYFALSRFNKGYKRLLVASTAILPSKRSCGRGATGNSLSTLPLARTVHFKEFTTSRFVRLWMRRSRNYFDLKLTGTLFYLL